MIESNTVIRFRGRLCLLSTEQGGRHGLIFPGIYRPDIHRHGRGGIGKVESISGGELRPGEEGEVEMVALADTWAMGIHAGDTFDVREGLRLVGHVTVIEVI